MNFVSWTQNTNVFNSSILANKLFRLPGSPLQLIPITVRLFSCVFNRVRLVFVLFNSFFLVFSFLLKEETCQLCHAKICSSFLSRNWNTCRLQFQYVQICRDQSHRSFLCSSQYRFSVPESRLKPLHCSGRDHNTLKNGKYH